MRVPVNKSNFAALRSQRVLGALDSLVIYAQAYSKHGPESGLHHVYVSATHVVDLKEMTQKNVQTGVS